MKPLLAHVYAPHRLSFPCYVQPKLNGVRALYQNGSFQSRDEIPWDRAILRHLWEPLLTLFTPDVILDGELYVHGWSLQRINGAVTPVRKSQREDTPLVEYHVFDVIKNNKTFFDRTRVLYQLPGGKLQKVTTFQASSPQVADELYAAFVAEGYEGMMYRLGDCPYVFPRQDFWSCHRQTEDGAHHCESYRPPGRLKAFSDKDNRCWHLLKRKDWKDGEFSFVSLTETTGEKGEDGFQMTLRLPNGKTFHVGSGLTKAEVQHYLENPPNLVKVKYLVLSDAGVPLNPSIEAVL